MSLPVVMCPFFNGFSKQEWYLNILHVDVYIHGSRGARQVHSNTNMVVGKVSCLEKYCCTLCFEHQKSILFSFTVFAFSLLMWQVCVCCTVPYIPVPVSTLEYCVLHQ